MLRFGVVTWMTTPKLAPVWGHFFLASLAGLSHTSARQPYLTLAIHISVEGPAVACPTLFLP
jgi:hypothetical protein